VTVAERRRGARWWLAWTAHFYTACGAVTALAAVVAIIDGRFRDAFLWMSASVVIDASDGWWARRVRVKAFTPGFDGALLDHIVDYLTYVFVPVLFVVWARLVPERWAIGVASAMLLSSAFGFGRADAKTADYFFTGFPSYWNIVVFYLFAARWTQATNLAIVTALAALVFVPIGYVYPSRMPTLRPLTVGLGVAWGLLVIAMIWRLPDVPRAWVWVSLIYPAYYAALSLVLHARRAR
jgi:phosphatidylcholine synthase